jgi:catechol 2,3-dioxygenase-like lactoylglutathione lyase family enzyme
MLECQIGSLPSAPRFQAVFVARGWFHQRASPKGDDVTRRGSVKIIEVIKEKTTLSKKLFWSHPVFPTPDILRTSEYYEKILGFKPVRFLDAKEPHVCLYRDQTEIILTVSNGQAVIPNRKLYGYGYDAYFVTDNQEELQEEFKTAGAKIARTLFQTDYHHQEFVVEDIDGRWIGFGFKEE